ncbi:glycosyltransferase family 4 protein [Treponema sp. J25]|uniref:glycosyltransferase family 4 protein n=1 Tax=Treponema sp. J25 TaxID=2094121 RepID=UPI00104BE753|nr:glycosyltransferase family 4 protein [Treponema sp. J25]TCW60517.1 glycosyltransferase family 1 protein [Treponema sp. J25]
MNQKKILFVITRGDLLGGAQVHVKDLARAAQQDGYQCLVACGQKGIFTDLLENQQTPWVALPALQRSINPLLDIKAIIQLIRIIRKEKPTLVSCHTAKAGLVGRVAAFLCGVPAIFTAHGWQFAEGISLVQKIFVLSTEYICARLCKKIIVVSEYDYQLARHYHVVPATKMKIIHNGMPDTLPPEKFTEFSQGKGSSSIGNGPEDTRPIELVMIARFQEQKDHPTLFKALADLQDLPWHLTLIGDGPRMAWAQQEVQRLGFANRVTFAGQQKLVTEFLRQADLYLLISHWEGFPRSILEAMREGLPVIASDVGGSREAVVHGETGFLVPRGDVTRLTMNLRELLENPELRYRMGKAGRKRFVQHFTFEHMYQQTKIIWEKT